MKTCAINMCNGIVDAKGFCSKHYYHFKRYGDPLIGKFKRHGMSRSITYMTWFGMKQRCYCAKSNGYDRYGGRGITVCKEWKYSFITFFEDMGLRPSRGHQIDRIDPKKGYYKDNCRWVTRKENMRHREATILCVEKVLKIKDLLKTGQFTHKEIGTIFNVKRKCIGDIKTGKTWRDVL